jgi:hypothetical protein
MNVGELGMNEVKFFKWCKVTLKHRTGSTLLCNNKDGIWTTTPTLQILNHCMQVIFIFKTLG